MSGYDPNVMASLAAQNTFEASIAKGEPVDDLSGEPNEISALREQLRPVIDAENALSQRWAARG